MCVKEVSEIFAVLKPMSYWFICARHGWHLTNVRECIYIPYFIHYIQSDFVGVDIKKGMVFFRKEHTWQGKSPVGT